MKIWDKGIAVNKLIDDFTVGKDRELDLYLAEADVLGNMAHSTMLAEIGLIDKAELKPLLVEMKHIYTLVKEGKFTIVEEVEDVHSQVEQMLTEKLGDIGKKIHSGRSRNDQVLVDLKLYTRAEIKTLVELTEQLANTLLKQAEQYKDYLMPGYTHMQVAMPSSFGQWFSAFAESLADDLLVLHAAFKVVNQNPLGSAAGYGSSFPLDRQMTTDLLGFDSMNVSAVYAQMGRGKMERTVSFALASIAGTLSKLAMDTCIFMSQNFGFLKLPDELTTGSSIMPHKKNPDVFELLRAHCNKIQALPNEMALISFNLPGGYSRDFQLLKESFIPAIEDLKSCLHIADFAISNMKITNNLLEDDRYKYVFSVEDVNRQVINGVPFRDAYRKIGIDIQNDNYTPNKELNHTHAGSIGNLCLSSIKEKLNENISQFNFTKIDKKIAELLDV